MIDQGELERIEIERAGRGKTGEHDAPAIQEQPELIPDETWAEGVGYLVDTCTSGLGTKTRSTEEKSALANCSRSVAIKRMPTSASYAEEVALLLIAVPLALSICWEFFNKVEGGESEPVKPTHSDNGAIG